jgi:hypothetical protein
MQRGGDVLPVRHSRWLAASVVGVALVIGIAAVVSPASSETVCARNLASFVQSTTCPSGPLLEAEGAVRPSDLPKHEMAPVAVSLWGKVSSSYGAEPASLTEVAIDFDRNGALDATGLPVCNPNIQFQEIGQVESICKASIVAKGIATFDVAAPPESSPMSITGPLIIINGGFRDGVRILYAEAFLRLVTPTVVKSALEVRRIHQGPYGLQVVGKMPIIEGRPANLLSFSLEIKRLFKYKGTKQSFATARCPHGHLSATISAVFSTGERIARTVIKPCKATG